MTVTYIADTSIGPGPLFTFAAAGDQLIIGPTGVFSASTGDAIADVAFDNVSVTVLGTVAGTRELRMSGSDNQFHVGAGGSWICTEVLGGNAGVYMRGTTGDFRNDGTFTAQSSIGVLTDFGATVTNTGRIEAASAVFLGLLGGGAVLVNSGSIVAGAAQDAVNNTRFNNGVQVEHSAVIRNLAGGQITATSSEGAGVNFNLVSGGSSLVNHGTVTSMQDWGVDLSEVSAGQAVIRVVNAGVIDGADGAYRGSVNADDLVNRGSMIGDVDLGDGDDFFDTRGGVVEGTVLGGAGLDVFRSNADAAESFNGGLDADTLDFRFGRAVSVALDSSFDNAGAALGDTYTAFERVNGSAEADLIRGNGTANTIIGFSGDDTIDGAAGSDVIRGGTGVDLLTGGLGNDFFRYNSATEFGDEITDFLNIAGNNDVFQISTSVGGGLVVGTLAASQFVSRADNAAQDADDRFIFRTTDHTLWFDADGNGAGAAVLVADLQAGATMTAADIQLI